MASQQTLPKSKPADPLEAAKAGTLADGTAQAPSAPAVDPEPVVDTKPPPAPRAAPVLPPAQRYEVQNDARVMIGRNTTWVRKGKIVSAESHDLDSLRAQNVRLTPVES